MFNRYEQVLQLIGGVCLLSLFLVGCKQKNRVLVPQEWAPITNFIGITIPGIYKTQNLQPGSSSVEDLRKKIKSDSNFSLNTDLFSIKMESADYKVSFLDMIFNATTCTQSRGFDPRKFIVAAGINFEALEFVRSKSYVHVFYDHTKKLKISVMCPYDDGNISVMASKKYYLD